MARFRFQFETVLKHRRLVEGEKRRALAGVLRKQVEVERRIREMQGRIAAGKSEMAARLTGRVDVHALRLQAAMTLQLDAQTRQLALLLAEVYQRVEAARRDLLAATKRRKAIEKLRERHFEEWKAALSRREAAELDDVTATRAAHGTLLAAVGGDPAGDESP